MGLLQIQQQVDKSEDGFPTPRAWNHASQPDVESAPCSRLLRRQLVWMAALCCYCMDAASPPTNQRTNPAGPVPSTWTTGWASMRRKAFRRRIDRERYQAAPHAWNALLRRFMTTRVGESCANQTGNATEAAATAKAHAHGLGCSARWGTWQRRPSGGRLACPHRKPW